VFATHHLLLDIARLELTARCSRHASCSALPRNDLWVNESQTEIIIGKAHNLAFAYCQVITPL
jgi:hypothetical protein